MAPAERNEEEIIIVNDLLCYLQLKISSDPKEHLIKVINGFYKHEAITAARDVLYRDPPEDLQGRLVRHTTKRDITGALYDVMQRISVLSPRRVYVCRDLTNVPPVSMTNVDPVMLYRQSNEVKADIEAMKTGYQNQMTIIMEAIEQLRVEMKDSKNNNEETRTTRPTETLEDAPPEEPEPTVEEASEPAQFSAVTASAIKNKTPPSSGTPPPAAPKPSRSQTANTGRGRGRGGRGRGSSNASMGLRTGGVTRYDSGTWFGHDHSARAPRRDGRGGWVWVTDDEGYRQRVRLQSPERTASPAPTPRPTARPAVRPPPVIGTGQRHGLRVVAPPPPRFDLYVSRLHPDTTVEEIMRVIRNITDEDPINVNKLGNRFPNPKFSSFRVSCAAKHEQALLNCESWDEGTVVRKFTTRRIE